MHMKRSRGHLSFSKVTSVQFSVTHAMLSVKLTFDPFVFLDILCIGDVGRAGRWITECMLME